MEVRIGIADAAQPITVSLDGGTDRAELKAAVEEALQGETPVLWLSDDKGRDVVVDSSRITHVEIGPSGSHPIGFS